RGLILCPQRVRGQSKRGPRRALGAASAATRPLLIAGAFVHGPVLLQNRLPFAPRTGQLKKGVPTAPSARSVASDCIWSQHGLQPTANARRRAHHSAPFGTSRPSGHGRGSRATG